ncbi:MAG TPA: acetoin utilization protein AcuC [Nitrospirota bacterium]|nr:acetoin utilization protein AcuC [Nitrospirota bacterium]
MKTAFIYSNDFARFDYGSAHPLKLVRLKVTYELIKACGLLHPSDHRLVEPSPARIDDLLTYHTREYIDILRRSNSGRHIAGADLFGLGPGDNPVFRGVFDGSLLVAGASLRAAELVDSGEVEVAFNIAGGLHHAMADHASGFCYINDPVIAIKSLVSRGRRVAYIDIDAHHGDGVQAAFYDTDQVLTISLHETGLMLFPGSGFEQETGAGAGKGYSVNVPLPPESDDELFTYAFTQIVPPFIKAFKPDIVVSQLGVDTFRNDPLAHLNLTTNGFCNMVFLIKTLAPKWLALGGGGYDITNVARAWTLAWAIINDVAAPEDIPEDFLRKHPAAGFSGRKLRDESFVITGRRKKEMKGDVERVITYIQQNSKLLNSFKTV